jgi:capsular polysaccharide biosynthesis protein
VELRHYLGIIRQRALPIALAVIAAVVVTFLTADRSQTYTAESTLYVGSNSFAADGEFNPALSGDQTTGLSQLIRTFAEMIDSAPIAQDALELTGAPRSADGVVGATTTVPGNGTNLITIEVVDADPAVAQQLATGLAQAFVDNIAELEQDPESTEEGAVPAAPARIFERAKLPTVPSSDPILPKLLIAGLAALAVSIGLVLLAEYLDLSVKSAEDAERRLELPVLGVIPVISLDPATTLRPPAPSRRPPLAAVEDG